MKDLRRWLASIGLEEYFDRFAENRIAADVLPYLTSEDLEKLEIPLGDRKRLLRAIASLREQEEARSAAATASPGGAGAPLGADSPALSEADRVERRQMTLMFVDLVGSTALSERLDLEEFRAVITTFHECCTRVFREHNGFIAQIQGDGVLAYFGYPRADEDDAERGVVAGLAIADAVGGIESEPDNFLQARVGIATGLVAVGDLIGEGFADKWMVTGETAHLASRLQALAEPGAVVVSDVTRNLLGNEFDCEDLGLHSLKGFSGRLRGWRVREVHGTVSRFESHQRGDPTPFVGRDEEIELLDRRWASAKAAQGQTVLISGEPGIGKSRLARFFCDRVASEPHTRFRFQCLPNQKGSPLHPVIARLERAIGFASGDDQTQKFDKLEAWAQREVGDISDAVPLLAKLLSIPVGERYRPLELEPRELKDATLELLFDQLAGMLESAPAVLVVEDLHWIDPTSQEVLDALLDRMGGWRLLVICTCRPEYDAQWIGDASVTYLNLRRLDGPLSAELVEKVSGGVGLHPELTAEILAKTDGVPLFLEELTKTVLESGSLRREGGAYMLDPGADVLGVLPTTLRGSLLARLDRLTGAQKVAPLGAAIGRTFSYALLEKIVDLDEAELQSILARLLDAQLLSQRGTPPEVTYTFKHALVQDVAFETLPKGRRREVHTRIAIALAKNFPEIAANKPETLADHYARSDRPAEAVGYWRDAAVLARQASANVEAIDHIRNALLANKHTEDLNASIGNEIELRELLIVPLEVASWGSLEIPDNLDKLHRLREARGDTEELLSVLHGISSDHIMGGRVLGAQNFARKILQVTGGGDADMAAVLGHRCLGFCDFLSADFPGAISHFEKTIALCGRVDQEKIRKYYYADSLLVARAMILWSLMLSGDRPVAEKAAELVTRMTEDESDAHSKSYALCILASVHESAGDAEACGRFAARALELSQEHESRYWEAWAQIMKGWALAVRGSPYQGIGDLKDGIAKYEQTGSRQMLPYARTLLADAYCSAGHVLEGQSILRDLEKAQEFKEVRYVDGLTARVKRRLAVSAKAAVRGRAGKGLKFGNGG